MYDVAWLCNMTIVRSKDAQWQRVRGTLIIWPAPWAGKMNRILRCDWLPERARCRWSYLARSGLLAVSARKTSLKAIIINLLFTKLVRSSWLDIGLVLFASLWTSTSSRSVITRNKNLANIQPSWPHTWSITHICCFNHGVVMSTKRLPAPTQINELLSYTHFVSYCSLNLVIGLM